ncbi:MAG: hypothetical protein V1794_07235, partial [Candidatus Glassbacteria bacterium]
RQDPVARFDHPVQFDKAPHFIFQLCSRQSRFLSPFPHEWNNSGFYNKLDTSARQVNLCGRCRPDCHRESNSL